LRQQIRWMMSGYDAQVFKTQESTESLSSRYGSNWNYP